MSQLTPDETLLGLLMIKPQHGYQLLETFQNQSRLGRVWKLSTSQLYAVLKRLNGEGFITGEEMNSPDAPPRTIYHITEAGVTHLLAWLNDPLPSPSIRRIRVEFLSRLYIAQSLSLSTIVIIESQKRVCQNRLNQLIAQVDDSLSNIGSLALELEIAQLNTIVQWMNRYEKTSEYLKT